MSTAIRYDYGYDYVFELASKLSPEEQGRLVWELPNSAAQKPYCAEEFCEFLLRGPVIDETQIQLMIEAKEEVNKCRPISW